MFHLQNELFLGSVYNGGQGRIHGFPNHMRVGKGSDNKAGYTAIQSRTVGQEQYCENRSEFKNVTYRLSDFPTDRHGKF